MLKAINRQDLLAALILFILPLTLFASITLGPNTLLPADNLFAYEPWASYKEAQGVGLPQNQLVSDLILENYVWKKFIRESIAARQIPLWNPYILSGQPFLANGQHSGLYPFSALFYILPLSKAYGWFTVSQLWLAGLFMYIFLRTLRAHRLGALAAGITYALSGFFIFRVVFTMIVAGAVWLPLILALIEIIIRKQEEKGAITYSPIPYVVAGALALGLQTLAGHVEITYYTLLVSGFYALCRLAMLWRQHHTPRFALRLAGWLGVMVILGVGLGAAQLVPMYEIVTQNFRDSSVTLAQVLDWSLPYRRIISFLIPDFFGSPAHHGYFDVVSKQWQVLGPNAAGTINPLCPHCTGWDTKTAVEAGAYAGILPLLLAFLAVVQAIYATFKRSNNQKFNRYVFIFAALALLSLLFAFGTPLYAVLFYGLPGWNQLHSPFRWIFPYTLSIAVLAGLGVTYLDRLVSIQWQGNRVAGSRVAKGQKNPFARFCRVLGRLLFWGGLAGVGVMLAALVQPEPFIQAASFVFNRSGLAQNAFANGRQFFGYQWPNFFKFSLMTAASGGVLWLVPKPIFLPARLGRLAVWKPLAIGLISFDLLLAGAGFNPSVDPALLDFTPEVVQWLKTQQADDPYFRLTSLDTPEGRGNKVFLANAGMYNNLFDVRGYDSIIPAQHAQFMQLIQENGDLLFNRVGPLYTVDTTALDSALLDLLGVRYLLTTVELDHPGYQLVYDEEIRVYENLDALPRAFLIDQAVTPADFDKPADLAAMDQWEFAMRSLNPRQHVLLNGETNQRGHDLTPDDAQLPPFDSSQKPPSDSPPPGENLSTSPPLVGTEGGQSNSGVTITSYTPNEVKLSAVLTQPGWLVLADSYFPGWKAYAQAPGAANEIELTIHRANGNFRAVYLQPGQWQVRFRYSPQSFQMGLYASFLAFVTLIFLLGVWAWGKLYREEETDSPIKRIAKNSLVPMVLALSNRIVDFAFAMLMLRILQPEGAGRYAFAVAFISLAEIITRYGLGTLVTREVAAQRDRTNRYLANVSALRLYLWLAALPIMGLILAMYVFFGDTTLDVVITIAILSIGTLLSNLADGLTAVFYAHEKAEYPAAVASVTSLVRVSVGALVLLLGWGIIGLAGSSLTANLVAFLALGYILLVKIYRPRPEADRSLQKEMMGESLPLMINHLLSTIFFRIDVFILKPTWGDTAVGYYNAAYKYIDGINVIPQYFTLAIFPLMSRFAASSRESLVRAYLLSLRFLMILALPLAVGTPFIARELILILAGEEFLPDSMIVLQLLIWFLPFSFVNQVTQYVLIAIHRQRHLTRAFIIGVVFNVVANLIFIPLYGYRAAAITTILSEWALLIPFYLLVRQNLCAVPWIDIVWRPAIAAGAMGGVLWFVGDINFFLTIAAAVLVYFPTLALVGGLNQQDMSVVWRAIPMGRLRARFS